MQHGVRVNSFACQMYSNTPAGRLHHSVSLKHAFFFAAQMLLFVPVAFQGFLVASTFRTFKVGHACLAIFTGAYGLAAGKLTMGCIYGTTTARQRSDWTLMFLSVLIPVLLALTRFFPLPTSDDTKANCLITFAFLLRLGSLMGLSTDCTVIQLLVSYPFFSFLDHHRRCHSPVLYPETCLYHLGPGGEVGEGPSSPDSTQGCCSATSLVHHMMTRGVFMLVTGLIAACVPMVMSIKMREDAKADSSLSLGRTSAGEDEEPLPFETFESSVITYVFEKLRIRELLSRIDRLLRLLADSMDEFVLMSIVCLPIGFYYFGYALLSRVMPKLFSVARITSDEWMLGLSVFFVLGRETCKHDMMPTMLSVRARLRASQEILQDVLPSHIVDMLLTKQQGRSSNLQEVESCDVVEHCPSQVSSDGNSSNLRCLGTPPLALRCIRTEDLDSGRLDSSMLNQMGRGSCTNGQSMEDSAGESMRTSCDVLPQPILPTHGHAVSAFMQPEFMSAIVATGHRERSSSLSSDKNSGMSRARLQTKPPCAGTEVSAVTSKVMRAKLSSDHAESHDCVTVFFSDIIGFSIWAHTLPPSQVMNTLNDLYSRLDDVITHEMPSLYKVETIGDSYMVAANLSSQDEQHAATMVRFALRVQEEAARVPRPDVDDGSSLQLRIGIHSGPAVTGIVGKVRRRFCMFGDTVNLASRCETSCPHGCIQVSAMTRSLAVPHLAREVVFKDRGDIEVKGSTEPMHMFLAISRQAIMAADNARMASMGSASSSFDHKSGC